MLPETRDVDVASKVGKEDLGEEPVSDKTEEAFKFSLILL